MNSLLVLIVQGVGWLLTLVVIADVFMGYFLSPYQPVRAFFDRIVQPILRPIQRILPPMMGLDFSPFVLLLLVSLVQSVLLGLITGGR